VLRANERVQKQDDSPVTVADFAAQAVVSFWLQRAHPSIALVAEETADCLRDGTAEGAELLRKVGRSRETRGCPTRRHLSALPVVCGLQPPLNLAF
jgi:3'-phosphoadenosine 5'-phosphosulfate (PAPS) 3'-phosphatase